MDIVSMLREEKQILAEILNKMKEEKEALIKDDREALENIIKIKEELKGRIDSIEKERINVLGNTRLSEILPQLEDTQREEARAIGEDITRISLEIERLNDTNYLLILQSLNYARCMTNILSPQKPMVYNTSGKMQESAVKSGILNKSV